jgi:hypothetical protein
MIYRNKLIINGCIFCRKQALKAGAQCGDGQQHCIFCHKPEDHGADPCTISPTRTHRWFAGHNFQMIET